MLTALVLLAVLDASGAAAQDLRPGRRRSATFDHKVEVNVLGGYAWTTSRSFSIANFRGDLDIESSGFWGLALDVNVRDGMQVEALYTRQDSDLTFRRLQTLDVTDLTVQFLQGGVVLGVPRGTIMPFTNILVGAAHLGPGDSWGDGAWKFAMTLGLGAKVYLGERFGLRVQGRLPYIFTSGGGSLVCNENGDCYEAIGGVGIPQVDLGAGVMVLF